MFARVGNPSAAPSHQQNLTLLAGVLMSTYRTCGLPQVIRKENSRKPGKLGRFLIGGLQCTLRSNLPHL